MAQTKTLTPIPAHMVRYLKPGTPVVIAAGGLACSTDTRPAWITDDRPAPHGRVVVLMADDPAHSLASVKWEEVTHIRNG